MLKLLMKIISRIIIFLIVIFLVVPVLLLGYLGFIPGLSEVFGSNKPRDLGIKYTEADRLNAYTKNAVESLSLPTTASAAASIKYEGKKNLNVSFTQEELTALNNSVTWKYYPISNLQIKISPNGIGEVSGLLHIKKILPYISLTHSTKEVEEVMSKYSISFDTPFYLKGSVKVVDNQVSLVGQQVQIGRLTIPQNLVTENIPALEDFAEKRITTVPNLSIKSFNLDGGKANFIGTVPEKEFTAKE
jgi:hypothetical protein